MVKTKFGPMQAAELLRHLSRKMGAVKDTDLASLLGINTPVLAHWRKETTKLSALQVANAIHKSRTYAQRYIHANAIKAIVEFFPIDSIVVGRLQKQHAVFGADTGAGKHKKGGSVPIMFIEYQTETPNS